ncbi:MAG: GspH/FimT family pseudopilin [Methylococcales bacterium]|nr:GspH/FimT family pseudopilin [Methylococcales bacterium]
MRNNNSQYISGFTLAELMIIISIVGGTLAIGIPSFNSIISRTRLTSYANDLVTALYLARSEAIKRGQAVSIENTDGDWSLGWVMYTDSNGDESYTEGVDPVYRVYNALPTSFTLKSTSTYADRITYQSSGKSANGSFVFCDISDGNTVPEPYTSKLIIINTVGRVRMGPDADNDGVPEGDGGELNSCQSPFY